MNQQTIIGRLGSDARVHQGDKGDIALFSLAGTNYHGKEKVTEWVDCALFGASNLVGHLRKGALVYVKGNCRSVDRNGKTYRKLSISKKDIELLGSPKGEDKQAQPSDDLLDW